MNLEKAKKLKIPHAPGVYLYKNKQGKIIYIGKAANLHSRVFSYWQKSAVLSGAKTSMLKQVNNISWEETGSEIEALLLEANLIKKFKPQYNVLMRDDKRYTYIKISTEQEWPIIFMTRKIDKSGTYFGPFVSSSSVRETLKALRKIWPYRSCIHLPKKVCLYYQIGKCPGMCEKEVSRKNYLNAIREIISFLEGGQKKVIKTIQADIKKYKKEKNEEEAQLLQNRLKHIKHVLENSKILSLEQKYANDTLELAKLLGLKKIPERIEGYDISNIFGKTAVGSMVVFTDGKADKKEYRRFKIKSNEKEGDVYMLKEMLERKFKHNISPLEKKDRLDKWPLPDLIIIDGGKAQLNIVSKILKKINLNIPVISISKGDGLRSARARDKLFFPGEKKPLELSLNSPALHLIKRVRDEAHRFAISYHRLLRKKRFLSLSSRGFNGAQRS